MNKDRKNLLDDVALIILLFASFSNMPLAIAHGDAMEEVIVISARHHRSLDDTPLRVQSFGRGGAAGKSQYETRRYSHDAK